MSGKTPPDWELAERLYRAGQLTLRQIAEQVGCTHAAIRKRATARGWERDLTQRVRETVKARVSKGDVSKVSKTDSVDTKPIPESEIVEGAVAATLLALNHHNHITGRIKTEMAALLQELADANAAKDTPLIQRAEVLRKVTDSAAKAIVLEREALGLGATEDTYEQRLGQLERMGLK